MGEIRPIHRAQPALSDEVVEYDETKLLVSTEIQTTAPSIISGSAGATVINLSSGFQFNASASTNGIPGVTPFGVGLKIGIGGLSAGPFVNTDLSGGVSLAPQLGIGGISYMPGAGVCSGFWCVGAGPAPIIPPEAMLIISGIEVLRSFFEVESEDSEALPLVIMSKIVRRLIPIEGLLGTWSFVRGRTGVGPKVKQFKTIDEFENFRRGIRILLGINSRPEAIARTREAIGLQASPFMKAELMDLLDRALFEQNQKDFPTSSIEKNIKKAVEEIESFRKKYGTWLQCGATESPPDFEIKSFMANALYLAKKLEMTAEGKRSSNGKLVMKIRRSAPFEIKDPALAARFIEAVSGIYNTLGNELSRLVAYVQIAHEEGTRAVTDESHRLNPKNESTDLGQTILEAEATRVSNLEWIHLMETLSGHFHQRKAHMRWVASQAKDEGLKKALADRISRAALTYPEDLASNFARMKSYPEDLAQNHRKIKPAVDVLLATAKLEREEFPGDIGNAGMLWDEDRVRTWARRAEIVDAFYLYGGLVRKSASKHSNEDIAKLARASAKRLINLMRRNIPEVRREYEKYVSRPEDFLERGLKAKLLKRIIDARDEIKNLNGGEIMSLISQIARKPNDIDYLNGLTQDMSANIEALKLSIAKTERDARSFRVSRDGLNSFGELFAVEDDELFRIGKLLGEWNSLKRLYAALARALKECAPDNNDSKKLLDKWNSRMTRLDSYMAKIVENHARFNVKRTGAVFMESFLKEAGIDPTAPRGETAIDSISGHTRHRDFQ